MPSVTGIISEAELGAQSVVYELATIAYMVRNVNYRVSDFHKNPHGPRCPPARG